jgi:phosphoenolpyruvate carboxykinase (ATP)
MKPTITWHGRTIEHHNPAVGELYRLAMHEEGNAIASNGALIAYSGKKTGRSPQDKRIVVTPDSEGDVWWGDINIKLSKESFEKNKKIAVDFLEKRTIVCH